MTDNLSLDATLQPDRVLVGNCPQCGRVCVILNNHGSWPLVHCTCDWTDATTALANRARRERGWARTLRVYVKPGKPNPVVLPTGYTIGVEAIDQADGAMIVVLPAYGEPAVRHFQWVHPDTPTLPDFKRAVGRWGDDALLIEVEPF